MNKTATVPVATSTASTLPQAVTKSSALPTVSDKALLAARSSQLSNKSQQLSTSSSHPFARTFPSSPLKANLPTSANAFSTPSTPVVTTASATSSSTQSNVSTNAAKNDGKQIKAQTNENRSTTQNHSIQSKPLSSFSSGSSSSTTTSTTSANTNPSTPSSSSLSKPTTPAATTNSSFIKKQETTATSTTTSATPIKPITATVTTPHSLTNANNNSTSSSTTANKTHFSSSSSNIIGTSNLTSKKEITTPSTSTTTTASSTATTPFAQSKLNTQPANNTTALKPSQQQQSKVAEQITKKNENVPVSKNDKVEPPSSIMRTTSPIMVSADLSSRTGANWLGKSNTATTSSTTTSNLTNQNSSLKTANANTANPSQAKNQQPLQQSTTATNSSIVSSPVKSAFLLSNSKPISPTTNANVYATTVKGVTPSGATKIEQSKPSQPINPAKATPQQLPPPLFNKEGPTANIVKSVSPSTPSTNNNSNQKTTTPTNPKPSVSPVNSPTNSSRANDDDANHAMSTFFNFFFDAKAELSKPIPLTSEAEARSQLVQSKPHATTPTSANSLKSNEPLKSALKNSSTTPTSNKPVTIATSNTASISKIQVTSGMVQAATRGVTVTKMSLNGSDPTSSLRRHNSDEAKNGDAKKGKGELEHLALERPVVRPKSRRAPSQVHFKIKKDIDGISQLV